MASRIVGVLGKKRAGKDTFARRLVEAHGFTRLAFADALREAALALDPIVDAEVGMVYGGYGYGGAHVDVPGVESFTRLSDVVRAEGWERAKERDEVRRTLQNYGVAIRELDPGFWVRVVMDKAAKLSGPIVITDVRFGNEATAVRDAGGLTVRVHRPALVQDADLHISETALDYYVPDVSIPNTGTVEDLHVHADRIANRA